MLLCYVFLEEIKLKKNKASFTREDNSAFPNITLLIGLFGRRQCHPTVSPVTIYLACY